MTTFQSSHRDVNGQPFSMPPISPPKTNVVVKSEAKEGESEDVHDGLHRGMKPRQLNMIAIAGAIGNGLIIGSGTALKNAGPAGILIGYGTMGLVVYIVMLALGEMGAFLPTKKSFSGYATRFVDPAMGFATGWNYYLKYIILSPNNLTATGLLIQFWRPDINVSVWIVAFGVCIVALNLIKVSFFGEAEFWMSLVKALVILMLILLCFIIALGGGPDHHRIGFHNWVDPGPFVQYVGIAGPKGRFLGVWSALVQATYAFIGTELVGVAFGEAPNPRKNVPKAIRQTFLRIAFFYVAGVIVLGMALKADDSRLLAASGNTGVASPFVIVAINAGVRHLDTAVNALLLVFTLSAANSDLYISSRTAWALAKDGFAQGFLHRTSSSGVPVYAVALSSVFIAIGFMNATKGASTVFQYFVSLVTVFGALNWVSVLVSYIAMTRGMKAQFLSRDLMPFRSALLPWGAYLALFVTVMVIIFQGFDAFVPTFAADKFVTKYIGIAVYIVNFLAWKMFKKTKPVRPKDMDLDTNRLD